MCDSKELLVGYLYDDMDAADRRAFDAHLAGCPECRGELAGLRSARGQIAAWAPPQPELGFRMVRGGPVPAPAPAPWRLRLAPAWGLAAAAALVLAASAAIANIEIRYAPDGVTIRTGWANAAAPLAAAPAAEPTVSPVAAVATASREEFEAVDRRLRELETVLRQAPVAAASGPVMTDAELLRRVRQYVSDAENRQQREVALQMAQMFRDFDRQRRTDLAVIQQGLVQNQGLTNAELATTRDLVNQLVRVSTRPEK
jgi:hypothetical protein